MQKHLDIDKVLKELKQLNMTEQEKRIAKAEELGEQFGKIIGGLIFLTLLATIVWAILVYAMTIQVAWVKVFGGVILFNIVKNSIARAFK